MSDISVLFSGGPDSILAALFALQATQRVHLLTHHHKLMSHYKLQSGRTKCETVVQELKKNYSRGRTFPDTTLRNTLKDFPNKYYYSHNICSDAAEYIVNGKVVGWFQGGMEFGPRALGNRSILANPLLQHIKELVNTKVKHRENFRPFAGSVLLEEGDKYFKNFQESPFMLKVFFFKDKYKHKFSAITHIDHSCRIQTVSKVNGLYHGLLKEIKKKTGYGVVLNTSLNTKGQPIVNTPSDALALLNNTDLDILILGSYIVYKL